VSKLREIVDDLLEIIYGKRPEPKRARDEKGQYIGDDESTPGYNEAWEDGKASEKRNTSSED
tara:strand:- start:1346 stop:1531 length:186 start_codon:yes stop_codon:yes gene_type:complete